MKNASASLRLCLLALLTLCPSAGLPAESLPASKESLRLVPFPKSIETTPERFTLRQSLIFEVSEGPTEILARLLNRELEQAGLPAARVVPNSTTNLVFRLRSEEPLPAPPTPPGEGGDEAYALDIGRQGIVCGARTTSGLRHGLQTLCQLIRANRQDNGLPGLRIRDWPSLRWRAFQDDLTRGPSSRLETLKFEADLGASLKLNLMTYYMEYQYAFKKHPQIGPVDGSLTPEELSALVAFAKPLGVDVLGNQQSFGHFGRILRHPEFAALRETPDILSPVREETYQLLDDLYSEVCPLLPFPWFNVCCDETEGLGSGPSKKLAAELGVGGVYVRHLSRLHDILRDRYQKRMMMWGDIILQHPDHLKAIPKDTIMLTWGYDPRASFEAQIVPFAKSGYEFFVCPGVSDWSRILPDFGVALTNIQNFVRDGAKHGAIGMINTDWQDDGESLKAVKWHADAWAAECAWNASTTTFDAFNRRVGAVLFGETGNHFGQAVERLMLTHRLPGMRDMFNARFWEQDFVPKGRPAAIQAAASNLLAVVKPALVDLRACQREAVCNQAVLEDFVFGARRMELIGQRMLDGLEAAQRYAQATLGDGETNALAAIEQLVRRNRVAHEALGREFSRLWLAESKPYALDWTMARYTNAVRGFDALLDRLDRARTAQAAGQPLPSPEAIGLALPETAFRRLRPKAVESTSLAPEQPWAEASATHRMGLTIGAGSADRYDVPVELEATVPVALAGKPVRAFRIAPNQTLHEVPAQLDPLDSRGKSRCVVVLPGKLAKGTEVGCHLYLGLRQAPAALSGAVTTSNGPDGKSWLENNQVRLQLGPEGAHLYRWEVKRAKNWDLTMPGETGWAGFNDINPRRSVPYELLCKARGPAMVEYECNDPLSHSKLVRLYAGASWVETLLSEPSSLFWDFDDPANFAADGPTPGTWLFSDGRSGPVGREADGVPAQVKAGQVYWGIKFNANQLALGLITPETAAAHVIAPGAGAGGVGIENSPPARHFVTFGGILSEAPAEQMSRLRQTLDLNQPVTIRVHALQAR